MWILTVVVIFAAGVAGVNIPDDLFEGPYTVGDQQGAPTRHATEADCESEARAELPRWTVNEMREHHTHDLEVRWRCVPEQQDL